MLTPVYSTCLHCRRSLGRNEAVEHFPVGRRLAFDSAKGRFWVVRGARRTGAAGHRVCRGTAGRPFRGRHVHRQPQQLRDDELHRRCRRRERPSIASRARPSAAPAATSRISPNFSAAVWERRLPNPSSSSRRSSRNTELCSASPGPRILGHSHAAAALPPGAGDVTARKCRATRARREFATLERDWREAEAIAGIADNLLPAK